MIEDKVDASTGELLAPKQLFVYPLTGNSDHEIMKAKKIMCEQASSMGFCGMDGWRLTRVHNPETETFSWRLETNFNT